MAGQKSLEMISGMILNCQSLQQKMFQMKVMSESQVETRDGVQVVDEEWQIFLKNNFKHLKKEGVCIIKVTFSSKVTKSSVKFQRIACN